ncbi:LysM peptidoglycan-binding domain-containing protein [Fluviicoccus keumensis]|uniref:lytic transglycosylase n=1 Tax=Fluviicoccus keumensis TaxID=1435465 RepID=UPI003BF7F27A
MVATVVSAQSGDGLSNAPAGYYDTDGSEFTQDDIDELLGVTEMEPVSLSPEELAKFGDLWARVRAGFKMDLTQNNERIAMQRNWFAKRQDYIDRMTARASHYLYHTVTEAEKRGLPTELALLPVVESSYDPFAFSPAQAAGMWQFIPGTGKIYGLKQNYWYDGRRDVMQSTRAAYEFLSTLYKKFGSWELALAAYNAGPGTVERAINKNAAAGLPTDYWSLDLPAETEAYVPRFLAVAQIVKSPANYNIAFKPIVNQPIFRTVKARSQVELDAVARIAGLTLKQLYQLNPGFLRWATDPQESHNILVPTTAPGDFDNRLAALPPAERTVVQRYKTRKGDTLAKLASRFDTSAKTLAAINGLSTKKKKLPAGRWLVVAHIKVKGHYYDRPENAVTTRVAQLMEESEDQVVSEVDETPASDAPAAKTKASDKIADAGDTQDSGKDRGGKAAKADKTDAKKALVSKDKPADSKREFHKVRPGETLYAISRKYDISPKDLARWNGMKANESLRPGKRLVINIESDDAEPETKPKARGKKDGKDNRDERVAESKPGKKDKKSERTAKRDKSEKDSIKQVRYEVRRGDTLYSISKRYKVSVSQIQTWNKGSRNIKPGQDLVLYLAKG